MGIRSEYYRLNGGSWELYYFKTSADNVEETTDHKVMTKLERSKITNYLNTFNEANKLLKLDNIGKVPKNLLPGGGSYLPSTGGDLTGNLDLGNNDIINVNKITGPGSMAEIVFSPQGRVLVNDKYVFGDDYFNVGGVEVRNLAEPIEGTDAATKQWVEQLVAQGTQVVGAVRAATTGPLTNLAGLSTKIDGITLVAGDRVLVKDQEETPTQNGVYYVSSNFWTKDENDSDRGSLLFVREGNTNRGRQYYNVNGTKWELFFIQDTYYADPNGGLGVDDSGFGFKIKEGSITNEMLEGNIEWDKLVALPGNGPVTAGINTPWSYFVSPIEQDNALEVRIQKMLEIMQKIRGTGNLLTNNVQSISDAYDRISLKNRIDSGSTIPATPSDYDNGDVYLKILSSI